MPGYAKSLGKSEKEKQTTKKWTTDNEKVIQLNQETGVAKGWKEGEATIMHSGGMTTKVSVVRLVDLTKEKKVSSTTFAYKPLYHGTLHP